MFSLNNQNIWLGGGGRGGGSDVRIPVEGISSHDWYAADTHPSSSFPLPFPPPPLLSTVLYLSPSCTGKKIWYMYSQKWNCAAWFAMSTFMYLWVIYVFPGSWEYINRSQVHEHRNWEQFHFWEYLFQLSVQCLCRGIFLPFFHSIYFFSLPFPHASLSVCLPATLSPISFTLLYFFLSVSLPLHLFLSVSLLLFLPFFTLFHPFHFPSSPFLSLSLSPCSTAKKIMYLWVIYTFPGSWEYINRSQVHECRNWEREYLFQTFSTVSLQWALFPFRSLYFFLSASFPPLHSISPFRLPFLNSYLFMPFASTTSLPLHSLCLPPAMSLFLLFSPNFFLCTFTSYVSLSPCRSIFFLFTLLLPFSLLTYLQEMWSL